MAGPLVYEVNTRCWLNEWSERLSRPITLATVPEDDLLSWRERGFTHVWLMGVWQSGPRARDVARAQAWLKSQAAEAFGTVRDEDIVSSPYAIAGYIVPATLGGAEGLGQLRARLAGHQMRLLLDFVPNHIGLDHPWITSAPQLLMRSGEQKPYSFSTLTDWIAHGKDPYFPGWEDTAQLDYRKAETRAAMIEVLKSIAAQCDGVRCDMAMLLLNDVFQRTWAAWPAENAAPSTEFWAEATAAIRAVHPEFIFAAEVYWDLEERLQQLGFDYCYDKKFYDHVTRREEWALREHLRAADSRYRPVRFLENHDEPRIASLLNPAEQKAATGLLLQQPGMRLFYDGQLIGRRRRTPVQFARYWPEAPDPEIIALHRELLPPSA